MKYFNTAKSITLLVILILFSRSRSEAQFLTAASYPFTASSKPYTYLTGGTNISFYYGGYDDDYRDNIPIGFPFTFCGTTYTTVTAITNGWMQFGNASSSYYYYPASTSYLPYTAPSVFAGWCDAMGGSGWQVSYLTTGAAGSRVFTLEFKNWTNWSGSPATYISYQYKLYEGANAVELLYKQEAGTAGFASGAAIGIAKSTTDWQTLSNTSASPVSSSTVFNTSTIAGNRPATGQSYLWGVLKKGYNNASTASIASPSGTFCSGVTLPVSVIVKNGGLNQINNLKIYWILDGVPQPVINWTSMIDTMGSTGGNSATVNLGNIFFGAASHTFKVYTSLPNGIADTVNNDDTLSFTLGAALSGVYYVGGASPDFATVVDARNALVARGVCGPVIFKIRAGTYTGAIDLATVNGVSATNRVTFMPDDNVPASAVNINYAATGSGDNYVFQFNGASYITLKNLTINSTSSSSGYGRAIYFNSGSVNDSIVGCTLNAGNQSSTSSNYSCISTNTSGNNFNNLVLQNNTMNGSCGIYYLYGTSSNPTTGFVMENNTINAYYIGTYYFYYLNGAIIRKNTINATGGGNSYMGMYYIYLYGSNPTDISYNSVKGFYGYGMYVSNPTGASLTNRAKIMNNVIISNPSTMAYYGLMVYYASNTDIINNTVITVGPNASSTSYGTSYFYQMYGGNKIMNNLFANYSKGNPINANYPTGYSNNEYDYNTYYTNGTNFSYDPYYGTTTATLPAFRAYSYPAAYNADRNSVFYDPGVNQSTGVPNPADPGAWALNGRGKQVAGNNKDFTGAARPDILANGVPDNGAFELDPTSIPPLATPTGPAVVGGKQYFLFGFDTVASVTWNPTLGITDSLDVRVYSGRKAPGFNLVSPTKFMYFYTDIKQRGSVTTFDFNTEVYYKGPWLGTMPVEANVKMAEKVGPTWVAYNGSSSATNVTRKFISAPGLASFGAFTGIDDGTLFSALIKANGSTIICNGSKVTLKANTGTGYAYQWNKNGAPISGATQDSLVVTQAGDYTVTITAPAGTATSITITVSTVAPPMAQISASGALTYCPGNGLKLSANTGAGLAYQWQLNGLDISGATAQTYSVGTAGTYTVKVKNIGCTTISNATVVNAGPLVVGLGNDTAFCQTKYIPYVLDAGIAGARYQWSTGDTTQKINVYNQSGDYWVIVNAGPNCIDADTIHLAVSPLPSVNAINSLPLGNNTYAFSPAGGQNINNVLWIFGDGTTNNNYTVQHTFPDGNINVRLVMYNDCGSDTAMILRWAANVGSTNNEGYNVKLYPNPAKEKVTLSLDGNVFLKEVTVLNSVGAVVYRGQAGNNEKNITVDISAFAAGTYLMRAVTTDGTVTKPFNITR